MQQREEGRDDESRENEREKMKYLFKGVWKLAHGLVVTIKKEGKHKNDVDKDITGGKQRGWGDSGPDSKPKKDKRRGTTYPQDVGGKRANRKRGNNHKHKSTK